MFSAIYPSAETVYFHQISTPGIRWKYGICRISLPFFSHVMRCAIWYHLCNLKNVKNTHGWVLLLVKLQASTYNFTKRDTPPWVFFTFFKLFKWNQIVQSITNFSDHECTKAIARIWPGSHEFSARKLLSSRIEVEHLLKMG